MNSIKNWLSAAAIYFDRRMITIFFLGISSGLPLALTVSTLQAWLTEVHISTATIGVFAAVGVPYSFKFIWSPLIDRLYLPLITPLLGRRRGWALVTQLCLIASLLALGFTDPQTQIVTTGLLAVVVSFFSASQDIVIDAFRVEILDERSYGAGSAAGVLGYRIGMLISGAGALFLSTYVGWQEVYVVMAMLIGVGILTILLNKEPPYRESARTKELLEKAKAIGQKIDRDTWVSRVVTWFYVAVVDPFAEFMTRKQWLAILLFIILYKLGDAFAGALSTTFYLQIGFSKIEIASVTKLFGIITTIFGTVLGGIIINRLGVMKSLLICGILQTISNLAFTAQAYVGHDIHVLMITIAIENITGGMGTAALVAYLSGLCNIAFTATQFALLTSLSSIGRTMLSTPTGKIAEIAGWPLFFIISVIVGLPGLLVLAYLKKKNVVPDTAMN